MRESLWKWCGGLTCQSLPLVTSFSHKPTPLILPQTVPPTGNCVFKDVSLWGTFSFKPSYTGSVQFWNYRCVLSYRHRTQPPSILSNIKAEDYGVILRPALTLSPTSLLRSKPIVCSMVTLVPSRCTPCSSQKSDNVAG